MLICMVRHGQTNWNKSHLIQGWTDNPLNNTGRKQAKVAGHYLLENDSKWDHIVTSPLSRAKETADIIASILKHPNPLILMDEFKERFFGPLEGQILNAKSYEEIFKEDAPGLESLNALQNRILSGILFLEKKYPKQRILITSHAQAIKSILMYADPNFDFRFPLKNSSLNYFKIDEGKIEILRFDVESIV